MEKAIHIMPNFPALTRRGSLLGIVIAAHVSVGVLLWTVKTVVPTLLETPLVVDLLQPAMPEQPAVPKPVARPQSQQKAPKTPLLPIEATRSDLPSSDAPVAVVAPPAPPAPPSDAVTQARFDADYLHNPAPAYPAASKRRGEEGKVILRVLVNARGGAEVVELKTSSGSTRLDDSALNTVRFWKFVPAKRGNETVQSWVLVPIIFKLEV